MNEPWAAVRAKARESIAWDKPMLARFKAMHARAKTLPCESFWFDGHEFLVSYAGYLIEYLESRLG